MNRLNETVFAIFISLMWSLLLKHLTNQNLISCDLTKISNISCNTQNQSLDFDISALLDSTVNTDMLYTNSKGSHQTARRAGWPEPLLLAHALNNLSACRSCKIMIQIPSRFLKISVSTLQKYLICLLKYW